ncbi:hypothetical protein [Nonomuraea dietziae]|uniref:hypothetical protein n=1 Tax=Nonomuraea dietziae TaxID=65515 RepID=UPI0033D9B39B
MERQRDRERGEDPAPNAAVSSLAFNPAIPVITSKVIIVATTTSRPSGPASRAVGDTSGAIGSSAAHRQPTRLTITTIATRLRGRLRPSARANTPNPARSATVVSFQTYAPNRFTGVASASDRPPFFPNPRRRHVPAVSLTATPSRPLATTTTCPPPGLSCTATAIDSTGPSQEFDARFSNCRRPSDNCHDARHVAPPSSDWSAPNLPLRIR